MSGGFESTVLPPEQSSALVSEQSSALASEQSGALTPERLDELLGDPADARNPYGFAAAVARDEKDEFPTELCAALQAAGFHLVYLPRHWGGSFESFDRALTLVRTAARRDVNIMPGTMFSIIAATCLQLHGSPAQQQRVAAILRRGGAVAFALTEEEHGGDLLANEVRLTEVQRGERRLYGEKWMVGNGLRCDAVYVVARTGERGPGAFSSVLVGLEGVTGEHLSRIPAPRSGGMRGIDQARLHFNGLPVGPDGLVGREGEGLEAAVKAQQAVRLMSMAGSLGIADTAVRLTLDFATARRFGRTTLIEGPYTRRDLAVAAAALLAADATALAAARGVHVVPEAFSVWGPAAKHVVAESADELIRRCGMVLAGRAVLRSGEPGAGLFQKLQRDSAVVRVIDASPLANLRSYAGQVLGPPPRAPGDGLLDTVFGLGNRLPPYEPTWLDLYARGADPVLGGLPAVAAELTAETAGAPVGTPTRGLVSRLAAAVAALPVAGAAARRPGADPNEQVDLAERYAWLHAAAACVHLWHANRDRELYGTKPGSDGWLGAALGYLLARADHADPRRAAAVLEPALDAVAALRRAGRLFTAAPVRLAGAPVPATP